MLSNFTIYFTIFIDETRFDDLIIVIISILINLLLSLNDASIKNISNLILFELDFEVIYIMNVDLNDEDYQMMIYSLLFTIYGFSHTFFRFFIIKNSWPEKNKNALHQ